MKKLWMVIVAAIILFPVQSQAYSISIEISADANGTGWWDSVDDQAYGLGANVAAYDGRDARRYGFRGQVHDPVELRQPHARSGTSPTISRPWPKAYDGNASRHGKHRHGPGNAEHADLRIFCGHPRRRPPRHFRDGRAGHQRGPGHGGKPNCSPTRGIISTATFTRKCFQSPPMPVRKAMYDLQILSEDAAPHTHPRRDLAARLRAVVGLAGMRRKMKR